MQTEKVVPVESKALRCKHNEEHEKFSVPPPSPSNLRPQLNVPHLHELNLKKKRNLLPIPGTSEGLEC